MAALILTSVATAAASSFGLSGTVTAALTATAAVAGRAIDQTLLARPTNAEGPRLENLDVTSSAEGAPIPRVYGRTKVGGSIIWATELEEVTKTENQSGAKGGPQSTTTTYTYYANIAYALCEGSISHMGRVWIDGEEANLEELNWRLYKGSSEQLPDPLIEAKEGADNAPAYRGLAYVVFERLPLEDYGNRVPQISFEVHRSVGSLEAKIKAVDIIPGAGEYAYDTEVVSSKSGRAEYRDENSSSSRAGSDYSVAMDEIQALCPNLKSAALVVSWFGTDLRAGHCQIEPRVDQSSKSANVPWVVSGLDRANASLVSTQSGSPAFGGTPNDASVIRAVKDLKARGIDVLFYPFVMMDVPAGSGLPDPYGGAEQAAYPWRGRITCDPAIGLPGTSDRTSLARNQIENIVGTVLPTDFSIDGEIVNYTGPDEWSLRRQILHYACLCKAAGGVDAFVIGSEFVSLSKLRDEMGRFPFVEALVALAADVRTILGGETKISYAADWSEYHSYRPEDGSEDVFFNLDPLWSDQNIDFIGIDNYLPVTDWRDGYQHLDATAFPEAASAHDSAVVEAGIEGGEFFDWFYQSESDRVSQNRSLITDGAYGKPWIFRQKDLRSWWSNQHFERTAGVEGPSASDWVPQSKPIWFTEFGAPAVDKGTNQPNVFYDPKSSESRFPHFSTGARDDTIQRNFLETVIDYWSESAGRNPISPIYNGPMIEPDRMFIWAYDARAFPSFPSDTTMWADATNWDRGHWLNARIGTAPLGDLIESLLSDMHGEVPLLKGVTGNVDGYALDRVMSVRDALDPLEHAFGISAFDRNGTLTMLGTGQRVGGSISSGSLAVAEDEDEPVNPLIRKRSDSGALPGTARITLVDPMGDYEAIAVEAKMTGGNFSRVASSTFPGAFSPEQAAGLAEAWLHRSHVRRDSVQFSLPPSALNLEPGDVVDIVSADATDRVQIEEIEEEGKRRIIAVRHDPAIRQSTHVERRGQKATINHASGVPDLVFMDLPLLNEKHAATTLYCAAYTDPWHKGVALYRSPETEGFALQSVIERQSLIGTTVTNLAPGTLHRFDYANVFEVSINGASLASVTDLQLFEGANAFALKHISGDWEILQAGSVELIGPGRYRLSRLLRGQLGTDWLLSSAVPQGRDIVLLDEYIVLLELSSEQIRSPQQWRYGLAGRAFSDSSYATIEHAPLGVGERPYAPAHLSAVKNGSGDLFISWVRRTRIGGDSWNQIEVPQVESNESYLVRIQSNGTTVREWQVSSPETVYSASDRLLDFPDQGASLTIAVAQISGSFGAGPSSLITLLN